MGCGAITASRVSRRVGCVHRPVVRNVAAQEESIVVRIRGTLAIIILTGLLGGCQSVTGRTVGQNIDDANITAAVTAELARDQRSNLMRIDVDTNNGVVSLNGTVESAEQRARAVKIARSVSGVKRVINNLQVQR